jgi:tRNA(fMet)-specific endonuclease VapC
VKLLLDSNAVIALLKGRPGFVARLRQHPSRDIGIPSIVAFELIYGAHKSQGPARNLARLDDLRFEVLAFDREDARCAGDIRATLEASRLPIGPYDLLIAGQALARGLTLITHNTREFRRVPRLLWEDWE